MHGYGKMCSLITKPNVKRLREAGARTGNGLAAQLDALSSCVSIDMPTSRRLPCTSNENTAAVVRCKCIEDDVNHVYYAD